MLTNKENAALYAFLEETILDAATGGDVEALNKSVRYALDKITRKPKQAIDPHKTAMEYYRDGEAPPKQRKSRTDNAAQSWIVRFDDGDSISTTTYGADQAAMDQAICYARTVKMNRERPASQWLRLNDGSSRKSSWCEIASVVSCDEIKVLTAAAA